MEKNKKAQITSIEQPFGAEPPIVHCPICGEPSMKLDENGFGEVHGCDHLSYIFVGEVNDFEYMSKDFQDKIKSVGYEHIDFDNFQEILNKAGYGTNLLSIEINYGGMAGGPVYYTDIFGFDYDQIK